MKLKERIILGLSVSMVLFTLLLVIDLQMDYGFSGHRLVPSHGKVRYKDENKEAKGSAYMGFRKMFLQRSQR